MDLFAFPKYLLAVVYGALLGIIIWRWLPRRKKRLLNILINNPRLRKILTSHGSRNLTEIKSILTAAGALLIGLALAGPQWGIKSEEVPQLGGNLVICMDISDSMLAQDIKPSRFERSKIEILEAYAGARADDPYRIGLVTFSGRAYVQCPLTLDSGALNFILQTSAPGSLPYPGTSISAALKTAFQLLQTSNGSRHILLVTDGEDHEGDARQMIGQLQKNNIQVSVLWSGNPQGEPIPMADDNGNFAGYKKDKNGNTVISRSDPRDMEILAQQTGGRFMRLESSGNPQQELRRLVTPEKTGHAASKRLTLENRFQFPLIAGFLLLLAEFVMPEETA
ncbi:MAG: VWA domain-containing protein [Elusimicrobia bacterium]|nr:VWA domain-containing protein [Elusimicrobiota bacterium]